MGYLATNWLKRIFSVSTITTIATVLAACIAVIQYVENNGGTFMVIINNKEVNPPISRNILVYLDKDSADLTPLGIFPLITNPSKYTIQDVLLKYKIETYKAEVAYTDFFTIHRLAKGCELTNIDKTLYAKSDMPVPFYNFFIKDSGKASVSIRATYKGVDEPFTFQANVYAKKVLRTDPKERHRAIINDAKKFTSQNHLETVDLYILDKDIVETHESISTDKPMEPQEIKDVKETQSESKPAEKAVSKKGTPVTKDDSRETLYNISENVSTSKPIKQIKEEAQEITKAAQEEYHSPWYMYILGILLSFVFLYLGLISIVLWDAITPHKDNLVMNLFKISLCIITAFVIAYYTELICFPNSFRSLWTGSYWTMSAIIIPAIPYFIFLGSIIEKWRSLPLNWKTIVFWTIFSLVLLLALSIVLFIVI